MNDCPYCGKIPGVGGPALAGPISGFDTPILVNASVAIVPTLGLLVPGYFLLVSREHFESMADLEAAHGFRAWDLAQVVMNRLSPLFGEYVAVETTKGSGASNGGGCVTHAHVHLIPAAGLLVPRLETLHLETASNHALDHLAGASYLAFSTAGQPTRVQTSPGLRSQWIRIQLAEALGFPERYDWGVVSGRANLTPTLKASGALGDLNTGARTTIKAILRDRGRVLLVPRRMPSGSFLLELPGGRIEAGESASEAFTREVVEETGLSANIDQWKYSWFWTDPRGRMVISQAYTGILTGSRRAPKWGSTDVGLGQATWYPTRILNSLAVRPEHAMALQSTLQ